MNKKIILSLTLSSVLFLAACGANEEAQVFIEDAENATKVGDYKLAAENYLKAYNADPEQTSMIEKYNESLLLYRTKLLEDARKFEAQGKFEDAIVNYNLAKEIEPDEELEESLKNAVNKVDSQKKLNSYVSWLSSHADKVIKLGEDYDQSLTELTYGNINLVTFNARLIQTELTLKEYKKDASNRKLEDEIPDSTHTKLISIYNQLETNISQLKKMINTNPDLNYLDISESSKQLLAVHDSMVSYQKIVIEYSKEAGLSYIAPETEK